MIIAAIIFIVCSLVLLTLALLPFAEYVCYLFSKKIKINIEYLKPVSIIITCYNEEKHIQKRIDYFLSPEEWIEGSELWIVSGGSTDNTNNIIEKYNNDKRVTVIIHKERISKIKCLNRFVPDLKNEIIIFSDCRQDVSPGAVKNLIRHFSHPAVSVVSATLSDHPNPKSVSIYRKTLNKISEWKSKSSGSLNVFGALYAQRKCDFIPFPPEVLFDDLCVVVSVLKKNKIIIQDTNANITDAEFHKYYQKERIQRLVRGLLLFLTHQKFEIRSLSLKNKIRFFHYKYLKLLMPVCLLFFILLSPFFIPVSVILSGFITIVVLAVFSKQIRSFFLMFIRINFHFLLAEFRYFFLKERSNTWQPLNLNPQS